MIRNRFAEVAQLVEHRTENAGVTSSSLVLGTLKKTPLRGVFLFPYTLFGIVRHHRFCQNL
jgi:hypothetical protein